VNTTPVDFGEIEFGANRTLAYVILATESLNNYVVLMYRLTKVASELRRLLPVLTPAYLESLSERRRYRLTLRLHDALRLLSQLSRSSEAETFSHFPVLRTFASRLQQETEDLAQVLERPVCGWKPGTVARRRQRNAEGGFLPWMPQPLPIGEVTRPHGATPDQLPIRARFWIGDESAENFREG
jgi:hypothetical protein